MNKITPLVLFTLTLLLFSTIVNAQEEKYIKVDMGLVGGLVIGNEKRAQSIYRLKLLDKRIGYLAGWQFRLHLTNFYTIGTGIQFVSKGHSTSIKYVSSFTKNIEDAILDAEYRSIEIPVISTFRIKLFNNFFFSQRLGVIFEQINLAHNQEENVQEIYVNGQTGVPYKVTRRQQYTAHKNWGFDATLGIGFEYEVKQLLTVLLNLDYVTAIDNRTESITSESVGSGAFQIPYEYNRAYYSLELGVLFTLKKDENTASDQ